MKTVLVSSAFVLGGITFFIVLWQLFGGKQGKEPQIVPPENNDTLTVPGVQIWQQLWTEEDCDRNKTQLGWIFTLARRTYDPEYRKTLQSRRWKTKNGSGGGGDGGEGKARDFDGMREKRASSIVTYFCIFVLVLSLIRAALDMNSNLKKSREENVNQTINLDSRRCSLNDFKLAKAQLKKKEQCQRRAYLLRRAMTIVESPLAAAQQSQSQSLNNLSSKESSSKGHPPPLTVPVPVTENREKLERQASESSDSPSKLRPRFSSPVSPTPAHLRRMSFPALRRGSSMDMVLQADVDELIAHHSPEVKRRMRLLRH